MPFTCPVCGYPELAEPPRSPRTGGASDETCPSCSFQFGYTDDDQGITYEQWRQQWIASGMKWDKGSSSPPPGWDPKKQLRNIGIEL